MRVYYTLHFTFGMAFPFARGDEPALAKKMEPIAEEMLLREVAAHHDRDRAVRDGLVGSRIFHGALPPASAQVVCIAGCFAGRTSQRGEGTHPSALDLAFANAAARRNSQVLRP